MASKKTAREMYIRTRRAWKDGSKIEIEFTSVNGKSHDYTVTLWNDGEHTDTCTCPAFPYGRCPHLKHFTMVEQLRTGMTTVAPTPVIRELVIEAVVAQLNSKLGHPIITIGASTVPVPVKDQGQMTAEEIRQRDWDRTMETTPAPVVRRDSLGNNRYRSDLPARHDAPAPIAVDRAWLLRSA